MATPSTNTAATREEAAHPRAVPARSRLALVVTRRFGGMSSRHRARRVVFASATLVIGVLLTVTAAQAVVDAQQVRIDNLQQQLVQSVATNENLEVDHANLLSSSRILGIAEHRLGMVAPASVTYLSPVNPGAS